MTVGSVQTATYRGVPERLMHPATAAAITEDLQARYNPPGFQAETIYDTLVSLPIPASSRFYQPIDRQFYHDDGSRNYTLDLRLALRNREIRPDRLRRLKRAALWFPSRFGWSSLDLTRDLRMRADMTAMLKESPSETSLLAKVSRYDQNDRTLDTMPLLIVPGADPTAVRSWEALHASTERL